MTQKRIRQTLTLCPTDWDYEDLVGKNDSLQIRSWCLDIHNVPVLVRYETYLPFIYFEFPGPDVSGGKTTWDIYDAEEVHKTLSKAIKDNGRHLDLFKSGDFVNRKTLYYYQPDTRPMLLLRFRNLRALNHAAAFLRKGLYMPGNRQLAGRVHLTEIDPILKMLVDTDLTHTCWFDVKASKVVIPADRISRLDNEYICKDWRSMNKSNYAIPYNPLILSYDIETYSHNHKATPRKWCRKDVITTIGCYYFRPQSQESEEYAFVLGDCSTYESKTATYELIRCSTEKQMIYEYYKLLRKKDPEFITGYNIVQYDNDYIAARLERIDAPFPEIGRLKGKLGKVSRSEWGSAAYGKVKKMAKWYMPGRVVIDYYEECIRNRKWSSYSLKNAAKMILNDPDNGKIDISYEQTFINYHQMCHWKNQPDCPQKTLALDAMRDVVEYCIRDAKLPADMAKKTNWIIASVEMSNVVGVTIQDMFLGGQQRRCLSLLYRAAYNNNIIIDLRPDAHQNFYYEGGLVQEPVQGYHELVITPDFTSLYPNIMIRYNLGHDTLIRPVECIKYNSEEVHIAQVVTSDVPDDSQELETPKKKREDLPTITRTFQTISREIYQGITPRILADLIAMRGKVRVQQKNYVKGVDLMWTILELRQLAYKVSSNSMYGFFGVRVNGKRPCLEISAMVTHFGRESITMAINKIKQQYNSPDLPAKGVFQAGEGCKLIYGDTDSCMFQLRGVTVANAWDKSRELAKFATSLFPPPLAMEAEFPADMLAIKMKHYAKMNVDPKTNDYFRNPQTGMREIEFKGLMPARRDTCIWAKTICSGVIALIMEGCGYAQCVDYIGYNVNELYSGRVNIDDLVISKTLNSGYISETATMFTFATEMAKIDKVINPGERHQFVVCNRGKNKKRVGEKMMLLQAYETGQSKDPIDYSYYYHNLLMKKLDIIINAEYKVFGPKLQTLEFKDRGRVTTGMKPAKLIYMICKTYTDSKTRETHLANLIGLVYHNFGSIGVR